MVFMLGPPTFATLSRAAESLAKARGRPRAPRASKARTLILVGTGHQSREQFYDQRSDLRQASAYDGDVHLDGRPHGGGDVVRLVGSLGLDINSGDSEARCYDDTARVRHAYEASKWGAEATHKTPSMKTMVRAAFCTLGICSFLTNGMGMQRMMRSVVME